MSEQASYRQSLRASSIIGGAQVVNIFAGLAKMKVAALLLGPAGVGLIGIYTSLIQTASSIAALGIGNVGTRQIAAANAEGGGVAVGRTRRALFWGTMALAIVGAALFWLASGWIARVVLVDETRTAEVAWLSLGVALTVAAGAQGALLTGLRCVGELARINMGAGVLGALLGVLALWIWGAQGLLVMVLIAPVVTFLLGHLYVARLGPPPGGPVPLPAIAREWRVMARLGFAFMISGLVTTVGHLLARALVQRELGTDALGYFQAAWAIGMTYLGFVLGAMGTDYYPRLSAVISDAATATRLVNEQTEVALLLCAPVLLVMLGLAPWVIRLLYSAEFGPAVEVLRWQLLGDILKVMSWPLGFVLLAGGYGKTFIITETLGMGVFVLGILFGLPLIGVTATGVSFLALYAVYLPLVWWLGGRKIGFHWNKANIHYGLTLAIAASMVAILSTFSNTLGGLLGVGLSIVFGLHSLFRISRMVSLPSRLALFKDQVDKWVARRS